MDSVCPQRRQGALSAGRSGQHVDARPGDDTAGVQQSGPSPQASLATHRAVSASLAQDAWTTIDVRDGAKGPLVVDVVKRRVVSRTHRRQQGDEALLAVIRSRARDQE